MLNRFSFLLPKAIDLARFRAGQIGRMLPLACNLSSLSMRSRQQQNTRTKIQVNYKTFTLKKHILAFQLRKQSFFAKTVKTAIS